MNERQKIIDIAKSYIGYTEGRNNANMFSSYFGVDCVPWCAYFVSYCAEKAGIKVIPRSGYVPDIYDWYVKRKRYKAKGKYQPKTGDLIIFGTNSHIGLVWYANSSYVYTIEGNTTYQGNSANGEGCYKKVHALNEDWVKGYCLPNYKEEEEMDLKTFKAFYAEMRKEWQDDDATTNAEMEKARKWAKDNKIIVGNSKGKYCWEDVPTREQLATMLYRFAKLEDK